MEKSLFIQYVDKYFKGIVVRIAERTNGQTGDPLTYRFKNMLRKKYSVDGKWESLVGEYTRVAADVVAMDSPLPLKKRDSVAKASGYIPKLGMELCLTEAQLTEIDIMIAQGMDTATIVSKIFADTSRVIDGVYERLEQIFLQGLSTGVAIADTDNVGTSVKVDYGYLDANKFGVTALWSNPTTAKPIDDISKVISKARNDGNRITNMFTDIETIDNMLKTDQMRQEYAFTAGFAGSSVPVPTLQQANDALRSRFGFVIDPIDRVVKTEKNGVETKQEAWKKGMLTFTTTTEVGSLVYARLAEMAHPVQNVTYQTVDDYLLVSKYRENRPSLREYTTSQARVVPVITNVDQIYTLDSKTVQA